MVIPNIGTWVPAANRAANPPLGRSPSPINTNLTGPVRLPLGDLVGSRTCAQGETDGRDGSVTIGELFLDLVVERNLTGIDRFVGTGGLQPVDQTHRSWVHRGVVDQVEHRADGRIGEVAARRGADDVAILAGELPEDAGGPVQVVVPVNEDGRLGGQPQGRAHRPIGRGQQLLAGYHRDTAEQQSGQRNRAHPGGPPPSLLLVFRLRAMSPCHDTPLL